MTVKQIERLWQAFVVGVTLTALALLAAAAWACRGAWFYLRGW